MPLWISLYCSQTVGDVTPDQLLEGIQSSDFHTLAEHYDVAEDLVAPARQQLTIQSTDRGFELQYADSQERPLIIHCWVTQARIAEEIEEVLDQLDDSPTARQIQDHMRQVQAVVGIELGFSQVKNMGIVFAYEIARWFGKYRGAMIRGDDEHWSVIEDGGFLHL